MRMRLPRSVYTTVKITPLAHAYNNIARLWRISRIIKVLQGKNIVEHQPRSFKADPMLREVALRPGAVPFEFIHTRADYRIISSTVFMTESARTLRDKGQEPVSISVRIPFASAGSMSRRL